MPRHAAFFGKYLRLKGQAIRKGFKKNQIIHPIPVKAYGRVPSAASQTGLYHDEDYNYYSKVAFSLKRTRVKLKPNVFKKDIESKLLNVTIPNVRVTTSAIHAMTSAGGFDNYILDTSPEHMRSQLGERMRSVAYFYKQFPDIRAMQLPWKVFYSERSRADPAFAIYKHTMAKQRSEEKAERDRRRFSPFYLPPSHGLMPERQKFRTPGTDNYPDSTDPTDTPDSNSGAGADARKLDLWWKQEGREEEFRRRLGRATGFDAAHVDVDMQGAYRKGGARGGGGPHGKSVRRRSKTFHPIHKHITHN
ncbi:mitochondrial ribosomal protein l28 [Babesia ovata]|uniref:Mitochondrial ribosomal protein l28 n=1 Tax=Babesia ovata TaxID=189622 RepID=A0A2H6KF07_9APIC|nr:mitochondrial ribosomal protein l28 [Babesia ovata]GBE61554.1 mitochondrial ribosomal protein l28 [Babesia ovata]